MVRERIDLTELEKRFQDGLHWDDMDTMDLIAELKICYEAIDVLSSSAIEDAKTSIKLAKKLAKQNRDIEEIIDCLDGVDSIFGEEIIGMLRPLLARF